MGMADVTRAFSRGLGAKGTCNASAMTYENDEQGKRSLNRLTFNVMTPAGTPALVSEVFPASDDPVAKAHEMGSAFTGD